MDRAEIIKIVLGFIDPDADSECAHLALRFRKILKDANPSLTDDMMAIYDQAFAEEMPALADAVRKARVGAISQVLTETQLAAWERLAHLPEVRTLFESLPSAGAAIRETNIVVFRTHGVAAHTKSAERLFAQLAYRLGDRESNEV